MSNSVSPLPDAHFNGLVEVSEAGLRGMLTLRGSIGSTRLKSAVRDITGFDLPEPGQVNGKKTKHIAWMSPDELLVMVPYKQVSKAERQLSLDLRGTHHLVSNVSDARAVFILNGPRSSEVLAKLTPADMSSTGFTKGMIRRTRLAQVPAAFWFSGSDRIDVVCFRSVAGYLFDLLSNAAQPDSQVNFF